MFGCAVPCRRGALAGDEVVQVLVCEPGNLRVEQRQVDVLALAGAITLVQRCQDGRHRIHAAHQVGHGHAHFLRSRTRLAVRHAGEAHQAAHRLDHGVVAGLGGIGAVLAEGGDRQVDEARVVRGKIRIGQSVARQAADLEVLDQHVGTRRQLPYEGPALRPAEIDGERALAAIGRQVVRGLAGLVARGIAQVRWSPAARVVAAMRMLDLQHLGAEVCQHLRGPGARQDAAQVEHHDALQRTGHSHPLSAKSDSPRHARRPHAARC